MMKIDVNQVIFEGEGKAEIFSFRPENVEKEKRGNVFLLGKIAENIRRGDSYYYILHSVAAILKKEYYSSFYTHPSQAFDGALKKINTFLSGMERDEKKNTYNGKNLRTQALNVKTPLSAETFLTSSVRKTAQMIVLALWGEQVQFSSIGSPAILLLRDVKVFRLIKSEPQEISHRFSFHHVTKGKIKSGDALFITTSDITPWLQNSHFASYLTKRPWERIKDYLRQERVSIKDTSSLPFMQIRIGSTFFAAPLEKSETIKEAPSLPHTSRPLPAQLHLPIAQAEKKWSLGLLKDFYLKRQQKSPISLTLSLVSSLKNTVSTLQRGADAARQFFLHILPRGKIGITSFAPNGRRRIVAGTGILILLAAGLGIIFLNRRDAPPSLPPQIRQMADENAYFFAFNAVLPNQNKVFPPHAGLFFRNTPFIFLQDGLYEVRVPEKRIELVLPLNARGVTLAASDTILFLIQPPISNQVDLIVFNPIERSVARKTLPWPFPAALVRDAKEFNNNLYMLESGKKEIVKYPLDNPAEYTLWIKENAQKEITTPLGFTVERSIYLLQNIPPHITELALGNIKNTFPFIGNADRIVSADELRNLYLLDSRKKRILVIQKESGKTLKTIEDPRLDEILDAQISEAEGKLTILSSKGVFSIIQALP